MELLFGILIELLVIIAGAKLAGEIFEHLQQPAVVGELLVGMLIGPHALGLIHESEIIYILSELAVIFLLFQVGLETRLSDMLKVGKKSFWVALLGVIMPFFAGYAYLSALHYDYKTALFLGAAMVATSVGITARVLADLKFLQSHESRIILGAAVIDDVLGMIVLAMVSGLSQGEFSVWALARITFIAVLFVVAVVLIGTWLVRKWAPYLKKLKSRNIPLIMALLVCLGLSAWAQVIGLAAIIGAFLAGMIFAEISEEFHLEKKLEPMTDFLVPIFFVVMGSHVNVALFTSGAIITMAVVVTIMAILTKVIGCGAAVLKDGLASSFIVGVGMMPRGEVGLIIAAIGSRLKIFPDDIYAVIVAMCMATTLIMPPFMKKAVEKKTKG
ncbi:cation:proton antiporter [candidate division FCPU426 bacterium]|nr:cation:proton antiporter [candidate division FCPU426 bacterium]